MQQNGQTRRNLLKSIGIALPGVGLGFKSDAATARAESQETLSFGGLIAEGTAEQVAKFEADFLSYFDSFKLPARLLKRDRAHDGRMVRFFLDEEISRGNTLRLHQTPQIWLQYTSQRVPGPRGLESQKEATSQKEILLAVLTTGRETRFSGAACCIEAVRDHVGVRQNITTWARYVPMQWPDGGPAEWNARYWKRGTPQKGALHAAFLDVMKNPEKYAVGCYTAAKLIIAGAVLDYYVRVAPDQKKASQVERLLWSDGDPLVDVEPPRVWAFEPGHDPKHDHTPGKLLEALPVAAKNHFVPGDWIYLWNTDPVSYQKTGYEGSNAIYLGDGRFSDYYRDNEGSFTFEQKLDDVYQWRNGVYSRRRDYEKAQVLSHAQIQALAETPENGGFLLPWRLSPKLFGFV